MINLNITNFRENIFSICDQTIKNNEIVDISTKNGDVILMSKEDYESLIETLYIKSIKGLEEKIIKGMDTHIKDCIPIEDLLSKEDLK